MDVQRGRRAGFVATAVAVCCLAFGATSAGAITVGQADNATSGLCLGPNTAVQIGAQTGTSYTFPADGTVTSFSSRAYAPSGTGKAIFAVFRPDPSDPSKFTVVGTSGAVVLPSVPQATPVVYGPVAPFAVQAGDVLGFHWTEDTSCGSSTGGTVVGVSSAPPQPGDTVTAGSGTGGGRLSVSAEFVTACADGLDNDNDGQTDFPDDAGCTSANDGSEGITCPPGPLHGAGADTLIGDDGPDGLYGGGGNDFLAGQGGNDCLTGNDGADIALGGAGADRIDGGAGADRLEGENGADEIYGGGGGDYITGGDGADDIRPGAGSDTVLAGAGNDRVGAADGTKDTIDCGPGAADVATVDSIDKVTNCETVLVAP